MPGNRPSGFQVVSGLPRSSEAHRLLSGDRLLRIAGVVGLGTLAMTLPSCVSTVASRAKGDVRAVQENPAVRKHLDLRIFPHVPGAQSCANHLGGGADALSSPGRHVPATCATSVRSDGQDDIVVFSVRWRHFSEPGFYACTGAGVDGSCLESAPSTSRNAADSSRFIWEFGLDAKRRIVITRVHGAFPPWWLWLVEEARIR